MSTVQFYRLCDINNGHDICEVTVDAHVAKIQFSGRDPTTVLIRFSQPEDVRDIAQALADAAKAMEY